MTCSGLLVGLLVLGPGSSPRSGCGRRPRARSRQAVDRSAARRPSSKGLAEQLASGGRSSRPPSGFASGSPGRLEPDGPTRFMPLPEVVAARPEDKGE